MGHFFRRKGAADPRYLPEKIDFFSKCGKNEKMGKNFKKKIAQKIDF